MTKTTSQQQECLHPDVYIHMFTHTDDPKHTASGYTYRMDAGIKRQIKRSAKKQQNKLTGNLISRQLTKFSTTRALTQSV